MRGSIITSCIATIFIVACSSDDPAPIGEARETILGEWVYEYTTLDCNLVVNFVDNTRFTESSSNEAQSGTYTLTSIDDESEKFFLVLTILEDNGLTNCDGEASVDLDPILTDVSFPDADTMLWSNEENGFSLEYTRVVGDE